MSKETLKQIKEQYARELHYSSWQFMCEAVNIVPRDVSVIAERYAASLLIEAQERIKSLEIALQVVAKWSFPETGKFWDDDKTQPMSFGACYGSNGERDYMRSIANEALSPNNKQK